MMYRYLLFVFSILLTNLFSVPAQDKVLFSTIPSSHTGVTFRNDILENNNFFYYNYMYLYNGAGVGVGDINNDGLQDLYFSSTTGFNKLYLNQGGLKFIDITDKAGVSGDLGIKTGVNMIDINNDGLLDIIVSKSGPFDLRYRKKLVYINNGDLTFTDRSKEIGLDEASYTTQTQFLDYDKDGDLDAFLVNHSMDFNNNMVVNAKMENGKIVMIDDTARQYVSLRLFENRNGYFTDISKKAGISTNSFGLGAAIADINLDGWPDIYVANDFKKPDILYINNGNGSFTDKLSSYFRHISQSSMGLDITDINNDGLEDIFILDMAFEDPERQKRLFTQHTNYDKFMLTIQLGLYWQYNHNTYQLNNGNDSFSEVAYAAGIAETDWSWGPLVADFDNDGWKDIYVANGYKRDVNDWDYRGYFIDSMKHLIAAGKPVDLMQWFSQIPSVPVKNYFYRNNGSLRFDDYSSKWSDAPPSFSNGSAYADLDNDGDLDIVINNADNEAFILRNNLNETSPSNFIRFRFLKKKGTPDEVYGVVVKLYDEKGLIQMNHYDPQRGYMSTNEHFLHFGLGKKTVIPKADILFPSGKKISLSNLPAGQTLTLYESDAVNSDPVIEKKTMLFTELPAKAKFNYTHKENDFIDFKREPLIPYKCSRKGPYYAKADINSDGREDIYIGGSAGTEGTLLLQNADGSFAKKPQPSFAKDKGFEDGAAVFFDTDGDKDKDLYVVSGGAQFTEGNILYQDRLYLNDGKGNFTRSLTALPKEANNGSYVISLDFDEDGDMDLFVGGGVKPGRFPKHDNNMLLQNEKGKFTDVTESLAPELKNTGIVNYAAWGNIDNDPENELLLAGEWMPVTIFKKSGSQFAKANATVSSMKSIVDKKENISLDELSGWWNHIQLYDIDKDGDLDIIAGNRGVNSKIRASVNEPCMVYAKDFDNSGSYDAVLGYYVYGKCYPMYHRDQLFDQMPFMRKKFYRYRMYAGKTMDELFTAEQQKGMDIYKATCFESGVFINEGNMLFRFEAFPEMAQLSTINDILVDDIDKNGTDDLLVVGNSFDADVSTGNYDAMACLVLLGDGKGSFKEDKSAGPVVEGEVRRIIQSEDKTRIILLKNSAAAQIFSKN